MIDESLARGLARQLLRQVEEATLPETGPLTAATLPILREYRSGVVPSVVATGLALRDRLRAAGPFPAWSTVVSHPTRKRIIVEHVTPCVIQGAEQQYLVCAGRVYDLTKTGMGLVETSLHTAISHHALKRLYQRGDFGAEDVIGLLDSATAFVCPILYATQQLGWGPGTGVAIPFLDGLLLGSIEPNSLAPNEGPSFVTVSRDGFSEMQMLDLPFGVSTRTVRGILAVEISTYIGPGDLFRNQEIIRDELVEIRDRLSAAFRALRTGLMRGYPDTRMVERFGPLTPTISVDNLREVGEAMLRFFATPEWERQAEAHGKRASAIRRRALN